MKTQVKNGASFAQLKKGLTNNNEAVLKAIEEHNEATSQMSNQEPVAPSQKKHITSDKASSAKLNDPNTLKATKLSHPNENGIAENITNGEGMVEVLLTYTPPFDPIIPTHLPASLTALNVEGRDILNMVRDTKQHKADEGNARRIIFDILNKKFSKVFNQLVACGASDGTIKNAKSILDKMRGVRKGKPKPGAKTNSISQRSFNKMVDHVSDFLVLLANCPEYGSNVAELKLPALIAYRDSLLLGNAKASQSKAQMDTSIISRNEFFNAKNTGYVDTYQAVKRSVKAIYGAASPQYHQVAHFKFNRIYS